MKKWQKIGQGPPPPFSGEKHFFSKGGVYLAVEDEIDDDVEVDGYESVQSGGKGEVARGTHYRGATADGTPAEKIIGRMNVIGRMDMISRINRMNRMNMMGMMNMIGRMNTIGRVNMISRVNMMNRMNIISRMYMIGMMNMIGRMYMISRMNLISRMYMTVLKASIERRC